MMIPRMTCPRRRTRLRKRTKTKRRGEMVRRRPKAVDPKDVVGREAVALKTRGGRKTETR
jgi:hypothetical protein